MLSKIKLSIVTGGLSISIFCLLTLACNNNNNTGQTSAVSHDQMVERGKYLVSSMGCNDCHTPMKMTAMGPVYDSSRFLSGVPQQDSVISPFTAEEIVLMKQGGMIGVPPGGAFAGGWGVSFPANLTPDSTTGLGGWNATIFTNVFRLAKFQGIASGRPLMPPMPQPAYNHLSDEDLHSIFAYLQTIPAVSNRVPQYIPFDQMPVKK